jgi:serine/threonine-protein kinase HipA
VVSAVLNVWMNGELVGAWKVARSAHSFAYAHTWTESPKARSLSLSLPITPTREIRGEVVGHFFDNLLPDNRSIRDRLARKFRTANTEAFSLLEAIGRDCVGAVQLLPEGMAPQDWNKIKCTALSDAEVEGLLRNLLRGGGPDEDEEAFRISLAGAQEKLALLKHKGRWSTPHGATPTTHILKLPLGIVGGSRRIDLADSVENEWLCAQIVGELGLPVATTETASFGDQKVLVVERFDREWVDGRKWLARLPQEDFCQALGLSPDRKYENDRGPGMSDCLDILQGSADAETDRLAFQLAQLSFWLLAACDGHAKNFSIFRRPGDSYVLTPLYDIISYWPYIGSGANRLDLREARLAMALRSKNAHYGVNTIQARHWHALALKNGGPRVWEAMLGMVERVESALSAVEGRLPGVFPPAVWESVAAGMRSQRAAFLTGLQHL